MSIIASVTPIDESQDGQKSKLELIFESGAIKCENETILGREAQGAEIFAAIQHISRRHAKIAFENDEWHIVDLSSTNGVYINDIKIGANVKTPLKDGDRIKLSKRWSARVSINN
jgi:pSer/pThr/pTyr-binding forkhead associated (FHA) protein